MSAIIKIGQHLRSEIETIIDNAFEEWGATAFNIHDDGKLWIKLALYNVVNLPLELGFGESTFEFHFCIMPHEYRDASGIIDLSLIVKHVNEMRDYLQTIPLIKVTDKEQRDALKPVIIRRRFEPFFVVDDMNCGDPVYHTWMWGYEAKYD